MVTILKKQISRVSGWKAFPKRVCLYNPRSKQESKLKTLPRGHLDGLSFSVLTNIVTYTPEDRMSV